MKDKPPPTRHKFANDWDEIGYLYDKLLYWFYGRGDGTKARPSAMRLARLLARADPNHEGIFGQECWSLLHEVKGDVPRAIEHRENEIRLIRKLHDISRNTPHERLMFKEYGYDDLSDRLDLLAILYHDSGNLDKALSTLRESKQLSQKHGVKFDGADLLRDYLEEKRDHLEEKRNGRRDGSARSARPSPVLAGRGR